MIGPQYCYKDRANLWDFCGEVLRDPSSKYCSWGYHQQNPEYGRILETND